MKRTGPWAYVIVVFLLCRASILAQQPSQPLGDGETSHANGSAVGPNISGTGTPGSLAQWTTTSSLGNSVVFQKSGNIGVSIQSPAAKLDVNGTAKFRGLVTFAGGQTLPGTASLGANTFSATQSVSNGDVSIANGSLDLPDTTASGGGTINLGGTPFIHACCGGSQNAFVGVSAGNFSTTGGGNTALGYATLQHNTSGNYNTAIGPVALTANQDGGYNVGVGADALYGNTSGNYNVGVGAGALQNNTTGSNNVGIGNSALTSMSGGDSNIAVGPGALESLNSGGENVAIGGSALASMSSGSDNVAIGLSALVSNATGSNNTAVGFGADVSSGNLTNATAIGACSKVSASNALVLGGSCLGANTNVGIDVGSPSNILTVLQGGGHAISDGWDVYSSRRWKSDVRTLHGALDKVERLHGVEYTYTPSGKRDIGVIAEEVGKVVPEAVSYEENGKDARGVDYARLTALLIEAVKEQQAEISRLESEVQALRREKK